MSEEIKRAAERRRNESPHYRSMEDADTLADAYLAEHPADEEEPLTAPFVESLGFRWCKLGYYWPSWSTALTLTGGDGDVELIGVGNVKLAKLKTRSDLRLLCRALSIPLTKPGASNG